MMYLVFDGRLVVLLLLERDQIVGLESASADKGQTMCFGDVHRFP